MTRQYVGARYVPKFYDFNGSPEWRSGVEYEALTIVTRNGNSYTSKKPVPSNIGVPENNTEYWVATGLYNAQVEAYRELVEQLNETLDDFMGDGAIGTNNLADGSVTNNKIADGNISTDKFNDATALKVLKDYVTPQMYGAKADGVTDDTLAIQSAIDSGKIVVFPKANYKSGTINISNNNIIIEGCGSTVDFGDNNGFVIAVGTHDITIKGFNMLCHYVKDSQAASIYCVTVGGSIGQEYFCYNINIYNCYFSGGESCVIASSVKNFTIHDCSFYNYIFKPETSSGGYGVLIQSCIDVSINNCHFNPGKYGRHDVYVSVDPRKNDYIQCKNVNINNCSFDHSELELNGDGLYYSDVTVPVNVRSSVGVRLSNSYFRMVTGAITFYAQNGDIIDGHVTNCVVDSPVLNNGTNETKQIINIIGNPYAVKAYIYGVTVLNIPSGYGLFCTCSNCEIDIHSCMVGATRIHVGNNVTINVSDIITSIQYYFLRLTGNDVVKGYCRNVVFANGLIGEKVNLDGDASVADGFFECGFYTAEFNNETYCYRNTVLSRQGSMVQANIGILQNLPYHQFVTLFNLPERYRPKNDITCYIPVSASTPFYIKLYIYSNGNVDVYNNGTDTGAYDMAFTITYIGKEYW